MAANPLRGRSTLADAGVERLRVERRSGFSRCFAPASCTVDSEVSRVPAHKGLQKATPYTNVSATSVRAAGRRSVGAQNLKAPGMRGVASTLLATTGATGLEPAPAGSDPVNPAN